MPLIMGIFISTDESLNLVVLSSDRKVCYYLCNCYPSVMARSSHANTGMNNQLSKRVYLWE
jgi:hypothetical protein